VLTHEVWVNDHRVTGGSPSSRASPLRAGTLAGTAPVIMAIAYAKRLEHDGVLVDSLYFSGQLHGFISMGRLLRASDTAIRLVANRPRQNWS
jgi:acetyl esterase